MIVEKAIAEHWQLLVAVGTAIGGLVTFGVQMKKTIRNEVHEGVVLALNNGGGDIVRGIVKQVIADSFENHQVRCPVKPLVESMEERLITLERRDP